MNRPVLSVPRGYREATSFNHALVTTTSSLSFRPLTLMLGCGLEEERERLREKGTGGLREETEAEKHKLCGASDPEIDGNCTGQKESMSEVSSSQQVENSHALRAGRSVQRDRPTGWEGARNSSKEEREGRRGQQDHALPGCAGGGGRRRTEAGGGGGLSGAGGRRERARKSRAARGNCRQNR